MKLGVVILPDQTWNENQRRWRAAEDLGFHSAWTYDHIWWRTLRDEAWYSAVPVLTAAAMSTSTLPIGLMVASPNFRHPVLLAKDALALADISGGRFVLGLGSGARRAGDAEVLGGQPLSAGQRSERFREFVELTRAIIDEPVVSYEGAYFSASEARRCLAATHDGSVPIAVAASGPSGLGLAVRHGDAWISAGPANWLGDYTTDQCLDIVGQQVEDLRRACEDLDRDFDAMERIFIATPLAGDPLASPGHCTDLLERCSKAGMTHVVIHWPRRAGVYAGDEAVLELIATEVLPHVDDL